MKTSVQLCRSPFPITLVGILAVMLGSPACSENDGNQGTPSFWPGVKRTCVDAPVQETDIHQVDPELVTTLSGTNGTFTDKCDENGNLIEYMCVEETRCDPATNPCTGWWTGEVRPQNFDCQGTCQKGQCDMGCPDINNEIEILSIDGPTSMTLEDLTTGSRYACTTFDNGSCNLSGPVGSKGTVIADDPVSCIRGKGFFGVQFADMYCAFDNCQLLN